MNPDLLTALVREADTLLANQQPATGLLPASTAVTVHGDYRHAWVRDNVYSILGPYAVGRALRRSGRDGTGYDIATIRLMRGLLRAMMGQADKVERFILTGATGDAIHAKFDATTGRPVCGDHDWGHLQLDATGLFLLFLAQFETAGLRIVETVDEARFVGRLTTYVGRTWKTPDYGLWERGNKINNGQPELNASSIGLCLAALEALDGMTFADVTLRTDPADRVALEKAINASLPAESASKSIDSALLSITGFPGFAVHDAAKRSETMRKIEAELAGEFGYKRFPEDGHQAANEDTSRLHYTPADLENFRGIECEWPLFLTFRLVTEALAGNNQKAAELAAHLDRLAVGDKLPELYIVPADKLEAERAEPGSQKRIPNDNLPLWWAQSLWIVGRLLLDGFILPEDIDPLGRFARS